MACEERELAVQIRAVSEIGCLLEQSARDMARASQGALADGDKAGAARELIIAVREYAWAALIWAALGQGARARHCRDLAEKKCVDAGVVPAERP
jgi:hypothetical protein